MSNLKGSTILNSNNVDVKKSNNVQRNTFVRMYTRYSRHYSGTAVATASTIAESRTPAEHFRKYVHPLLQPL